MQKITDPEVLAFIEKTESYYPADSNLATAEQNRANYDRMCAAFRQPRPDSVTVRDSKIGSVSVRQYVPVDFDETKPEAVYLHGGGFVVGSLDSHDDICAELAESSGLRVTSVDYRLAPESPAPAQLNDVEEVWRHLALGNKRLIAIGDSAGGNLCVGLSLRMRRVGGAMPQALVLIYPGLGGDLALASYIENAEAPLLRTIDLHAYRALTDNLPLTEDERRELAPLTESDLSGLPTTYVYTADVDPVRDDGKVFVDRLLAAGITAHWRNEPQLVHGYLRGRRMSSRIAESFDSLCNCVRMLGRSQ